MVGAVLLLEHPAESCEFMIKLCEAQQVLNTDWYGLGGG